jgi:chromatin structure-remodeling complex subunit RSC9
MVLALESGIVSEVSWSLNRLLRVSASDRFHIQLFPTLPALLCQWPEWFLEHIDDEDSLTFSPDPTYTINRRLALNSLLVLKNAALNDTVLKHPTITDDAPTFLAKIERVRTLVFAILEKFGHRTDDSVQEAVLTALDLFRYTIQKWPAPPTFEQTQSIVSIVGRSHDRAVLISGWSGLYNLLDTFTTVTHVTPQSEALEAAIRVLPVYVDTHMSYAALDYILAHLSNPSLAKAFLHHPAMPQVLRILAQRLLFDQQKVVEIVNVTLGVPPRTMIAQNNAIGFIELTREELDEMSGMTEPSRVTKW